MPPRLPAAGLSVELQPRLTALSQAIDGLEIDKWRATRQVKEMMAGNLDSTRKDLKQTLPGLIATADSSPDSVPALLAVSRNLGALYDVALRVTVVADSAAPQPQAQALANALAGVDVGRRGLNNRLQSAADAETRQVADLRKTVASLKTAALPPPSPPIPLCPAPAVRKKKPAPQPAPKPATPPPPTL